MDGNLFILLGVMAFGITIRIVLARLLFKNSLTFWVGMFFIIMVNMTLILNKIEFSQNVLSAWPHPINYSRVDFFVEPSSHLNTRITSGNRINIEWFV